ncbi:T9SS type A sorting domain-containing protein [Flavivirga aquimarina]|uniref:T9SS type A sorting domain-containing protein n=1 Tax=Flavivirga aquimarina TaxID=2027862 RepID=A0ABT8WAH7_9FLAO|nr:T9SS type A sorting domain-containing protein [Flavivirga aquimarina]MDO5970143.1 T9SS type A sorting domain-containing protein [Flavivirga aquimarina]
MAQTTDWAVSYGSTSEERIILSKVDNNGNVYSAGTYQETYSHNGQNLLNIGLRDVFIEKRDSQGQFLWVKTIKSTFDETLLGISITNNGDILVSGTFQNTLDANPSDDIHNLVSNGDADIYVIKLNPNGDFLWAVNYGNSEGDYLMDLETDNQGNTLLSIVFRNSLTLSPSITIETPFSTLDLSNGLVKIDQNGNVLWAYATGTAYAKDITFDDKNNIYVAGFFLIENDFDYKEGTFLMTETGSTLGSPIGIDSYIQKLDSEGNFIWAKQLKNPYSVVIHSIVVDTNENVYTTGVWQGSPQNIDFDPGIAIFSVPAPNTSESKQFIHKLNVLGDFEWVTTFGTWYSTPSYLDPEQGGFLSIDSNNNLYYAGDVRNIVGTTGFSFGENTYLPIDQDILLGKINTIDGSVEWSSMLGGSGNHNVYEANIDSNDNLIISGNFQNTVDFSIDSNQTIALQTIGLTNFFVFKTNFSSVLSTNEVTDLNSSFNTYPNPVKDKIYIENNTGVIINNITLYDANGRVLKIYKSSNPEINVEFLSKGIYILKVKSEEGNTFARKVIKN